MDIMEKDGFDLYVYTISLCKLSQQSSSQLIQVQLQDYFKYAIIIIYHKNINTYAQKTNQLKLALFQWHY